MIRHLIILTLFPLFACGQTNSSGAKQRLTQLYTQAIDKFINTANKKNGVGFDTLYIAKRKLGQPDDFPDIELPASIRKTQIRLVSPEEGAIMQQQLKSRIYINLFGWVEDKQAEFLFVVFSNGLEHQYDYTLNYTLQHQQFELESIRFKGPPFD